MDKFVELAFVAYQSIVLIHQQSCFLTGKSIRDWLQWWIFHYG